MYSKFAPDYYGTRFSLWRRSEDIVSRVACGVAWTILILVKNDCEKKNKKQKNKKNIADV